MSDWKKMELFEREAKILSQLNHPAIPRYLDYFQVDTNSDHSFYIAQQLAPGTSLAMLIENGWRPHEGEVRQIAAQILEILIYLAKGCAERYLDCRACPLIQSGASTFGR
jgi:eukaryotic-like serine/threonine-protein kinase